MRRTSKNSKNKIIKIGIYQTDPESGFIKGHEDNSNRYSVLNKYTYLSVKKILRSAIDKNFVFLAFPLYTCIRGNTLKRKYASNEDL